MAKIIIPDLLAQASSTIALNLRFQQLEDELNDKVLYRDNPVGEPNAMSVDLDMAGKDIINVGNISDTSTPAIDASNVVVTPAGNIQAVTAQLALEELDVEKALLAGDATQPFSASALTLGGLIVESGATADQTDAEIKIAYENNANTEAFTTDNQTTVLSVENGADVTDAANVASAGAVMDSDISDLSGVVRKTGAGTYEGVLSQLAGTSAPSGVNNFSQGYSLDSTWLDVSPGSEKAFICVGDGVWLEAGSSVGGSITSLNTTAPIVDTGTPTIPAIGLDFSAVIGSSMTGFTLSNNALFVLDISTGVCLSDDGVDLISTSSVFSKDFNAPWVLGSGNGGWDGTGTAMSAGGYAKIYMIYNPTTGVVDALSVRHNLAISLPAGFTKKRFIGLVFTVGALWSSFVHTGDTIRFSEALESVNSTAAAFNAKGVVALTPDVLELDEVVGTAVIATSGSTRVDAVYNYNNGGVANSWFTHGSSDNGDSVKYPFREAIDSSQQLNVGLLGSGTYVSHIHAIYGYVFNSRQTFNPSY